jgi:hypothetical protein
MSKKELNVKIYKTNKYGLWYVSVSDLYSVIDGCAWTLRGAKRKAKKLISRMECKQIGLITYKSTSAITLVLADCARQSREIHFSNGEFDERCVECNHPFPCDSHILADTWEGK